MLSIAFSASIGGIATLIGTPPNLVFAGIIQELYGKEISFLKWIIFGLPISIILLTISWIYLTRVAFKFSKTNFDEGQAEIKMQLTELGEVSYEEKIVLVVFVITGAAWISRTFFLNLFLPSLDDSMIALMSGISLFLISTGKEYKDKKIMHWEDAVKLPWGILLLFGGGLAIAAGFQSSGLAIWIAEKLSKLDEFSLFIIFSIFILF